MAETPSYNHIDIQRYLQHKMSSQEMREFEKALMNDPFLADALEGFSKSEETLSKTHLQQIETAITGEQQKAKVVPLTLQKTQWWKVAAVLLLIVSAGVITFSVLNNKSVNKKNDQIAASLPAAVTKKEDTVSASDKPLARADVFREPQISVRRKTTSPIIRPTTPAQTAAINKTEEDLAKRSEEKKELNQPVASSFATRLPDQTNNIASARTLNLRASTAEKEFTGKVLDESGKPLAGASIIIEGRRVGISADTNGNFTLKAPDTALNVSAVAVGHRAKVLTIKSNTPSNTITLDEGNLSLSEVVVTAKRKMNENAGPTIRVDSSSATPAEGWMHYQQYMHQQSAAIQESDKNNSNKEIQIEFFVDIHGKPTNVKVLTKMDKRRAEKITEIIENGPIWQNSEIDKKVKVIIQLH